jgi:glycine/D-amino acid oxidase-like deaminating enzyme
VDYLSQTADGRILFGSRGAPYRFDSRITEAQDRHAPTHEMIRRMFLDWFPMLRGIQFTHAWGGPVGMPRDWMPTMSYDPAANVATARGYTGQGVATSNLSGRVLTDLITGVDSPLTKLPMVGHHSPDWEPEPVRWLAIRYMQWAYGRLDARAERTGRAPTGKTLAERLGRH